MAVIAALTGCPDDPPMSEGDGSSDTTAAPTDTGGDTIGTTDETTTDVADTTAASTSGVSSSTGDGDSTTTGAMAGDGRVRLLLGTGGELGNGFFALSIFEYDAGQTSDVVVHDPLPADRLIFNWGFSRGGQYVYWRTADTATDDDDRSFVAPYADGVVGVPTRINGAPAPDPGLGGNPEFSDDDSAIVFFAIANEMGDDPGIWINAAGGDAPDAPVLLHPALGPGDDVDFDLSVGPGDAGVAFNGDFTGAGLTNLHLASSDPAQAGAATQLTQHDDPAQNVAFGSVRWLPDGSGLVYRADSETDTLDELWWIGLSGAMPTAPVKVNDVVAPGSGLSAVRLSPDGSAVAWWVGEGSGGDIAYTSLDAGGPGLVEVLSTPGPDEAFAAGLRWSPNGDALIYLGEHDTLGNRDAYYVDMSGGTPAAPDRINAALIPGGQVISAYFGPEGNYLYYVAQQDDEGAELYRVAVVDGVPLTSEKLSGELVDGGSLSGEVVFAPDGSSLIYTGEQDASTRRELYRVELGDDPGPAERVNPNLPPGVEVQFAATYSADSTMIVYGTRESSELLTLWLEDLTDGLANPIEVSTEVQGYNVLPF